MEVKVKKLNENAVIPFKAYHEDFCYDCVATSCEEISPNVYKYGIGLAFEIKREKIILEKLVTFGGTLTNGNRDIDLNYSDIKLSLDFRPRSSIYKTGMILSNAVGTIDELYRGEVSAIFYHVMPNMPKYEIGDRIGQIKLGFTLPIDFEVVEQLNETNRGEGGFGSTGK